MGEIHLFRRIKIRTPFFPDTRMINGKARRISKFMGNFGNHEFPSCHMLSFKVLKGEEQRLIKGLLIQAVRFTSCTV